VDAVTYAAIASAIAAGFSAVSAFFAMRIQRPNLGESVRPELVLTDWSRTSTGDGSEEILRFAGIKNVGRGTALHVVVSGSRTVDNRPVFVTSTQRIAILAPNEAKPIDGRTLIAWQNVGPQSDGSKYLGLTIQIACWDLIWLRHRTRYILIVSQKGSMPEALAPGVALTNRVTETRSRRRLKLLRTIGRVPRSARRKVDESL
jgi:hypothetical protein